MGKKFDFEFSPFTFDQLREMSEEDLYKSINSFKRMMREASRSGKETQSFEVEFCYLEHERIMRARAKEYGSKISSAFKANNSKNKYHNSQR